QLVNDPPTTYGWTPATPLQSGTTYYWKVVSRTNATPIIPSLIATSPTWSFTTSGSPGGPPPAPSTPTPDSGSTDVGTSPTLNYQASSIGTTYDIAFGPSNPPPRVAPGLGAATY